MWFDCDKLWSDERYKSLTWCRTFWSSHKFPRFSQRSQLLAAESGGAGRREESWLPLPTVMCLTQQQQQQPNSSRAPRSINSSASTVSLKTKQCWFANCRQCRTRFVYVPWWWWFNVIRLEPFFAYPKSNLVMREYAEEADFAIYSRLNYCFKKWHAFPLLVTCFRQVVWTKFKCRAILCILHRPVTGTFIQENWNNSFCNKCIWPFYPVSFSLTSKHNSLVFFIHFINLS